jgi:hypothetical protein
MHCDSSCTAMTHASGIVDVREESDRLPDKSTFESDRAALLQHTSRVPFSC